MEKRPLTINEIVEMWQRQVESHQSNLDRKAITGRRTQDRSAQSVSDLSALPPVKSTFDYDS